MIGQQDVVHGIEREVLAWVGQHRAEVLDDLARLVALESPTGDDAALRRMADWLSSWFAVLGEVTEVVTAPGTAPHLRVDLGGGGAVGRAPLVLCHYDTVWPLRTVEERPFAVRGDEALGPGVLDMKASIVLVHWAHRALRALGRDVTARLLLTADEERVNPTSVGLIEELAREASVALVMEPPLPDGRLKVARKGYARIRLDVVGRAAHAGVAPQDGVNAALEAAYAAVHAAGLADDASGTIVTVGVLRAGMQSNVVPPAGCLELDVRVADHAELDRVVRALQDRPPVVAGARTTATVEVRRAPMACTQATADLLALAGEVGARIGVPIAGAATGGISEGNLTSGIGVPTLDGLGVVGIGPHTDEERISVASLIERVALYAGILAAAAGHDRANAVPESD